MATRSWSAEPLKGIADRDCIVVTWTGLLNGDDGEPFRQPGAADKTIQVLGTFGVGGTLRLEGSNKNAQASAGPTLVTDYSPLADPQGTALDIVAADPPLEQVLENPVWIRPRVTGGDGTTDFEVRILFRKR